MDMAEFCKMFTKADGRRIWHVSQRVRRMLNVRRCSKNVIQIFYLILSTTSAFRGVDWSIIPILLLRWTYGISKQMHGWVRVHAPLPIPGSCLILFHPALRLLNPFSKLVPTISPSAIWDKPLPSWVRRTAAGAGSPPVPFLQGPGTSRRVLGAHQPRSHICSLFIIHSSNKCQVRSCPGPTTSMILAFLWSSGLKDQRQRDNPWGSLRHFQKGSFPSGRNWEQPHPTPALLLSPAATELLTSEQENPRAFLTYCPKRHGESIREDFLACS